MKRKLLSFCVLALLAMPRIVHAQNDPSAFPAIPPISAVTTTSSTSVATTTVGIGVPPSPTQSSAAIAIVQVPQPSQALAPRSVITPTTSVGFKGVAGTASVDGVSIEVRDENGHFVEAGFIDGVVLLDQNNKPRGPVQKYNDPYDRYSPSGNRIIMERISVFGESTRIHTVTVGVLTKPSISNGTRKYFSVVITSIITTADVTGFPGNEGGVVGPLKSLDADFQVGNSTMSIGSKIVGQNVYPLIPGQPGMELRQSVGLQGRTMLLLVVDARGRGGRMDDIFVTLRRGSDGLILAGPQSMVASLLYGQGSVKFESPFRTLKDTIGDCLISFQLGDTWNDGGTISFSVDPTKCLVQGEDDGYMTIPLPGMIISGPLMTVLSVTTEFGSDQVVEIDTGGNLVTGVNDLTAVEISALADKPLAVPGLSGWVGFKSSDTVTNVGFYGYLDKQLTQPIPGLQPDGSFQKGRKGQIGPFFVGVEDAEGNSSAAIIPAGTKGYFVLRVNFSSSKPHSQLLSEIFDWYSDETLAQGSRER